MTLLIYNVQLVGKFYHRSRDTIPILNIEDNLLTKHQRLPRACRINVCQIEDVKEAIHIEIAEKNSP